MGVSDTSIILPRRSSFVEFANEGRSQGVWTWCDVIAGLFLSRGKSTDIRAYRPPRRQSSTAIGGDTDRLRRLSSGGTDGSGAWLHVVPVGSRSLVQAVPMGAVLGFRWY
ncbi:hypothetical protein J6590_036855 [Homalodisca vitripennis]|nr:hypothetical protein J6590_036855 [Homalodisca vitripennis]